MKLSLLHEISGSATAWSAFLQREVLLSVVLFAVLFPLSMMLKKRSPYLQYGLWILFFLRLTLPTDFSFPLSARSLLDMGTRSLGGEAITLGTGQEPHEEPPPPWAEFRTPASAKRAERPLWKTGFFLFWCAGAAMLLLAPALLFAAETVTDGDGYRYTVESSIVLHVQQPFGPSPSSFRSWSESSIRFRMLDPEGREVLSHYVPGTQGDEVDDLSPAIGLNPVDNNIYVIWSRKDGTDFDLFMSSFNGEEWTPRKFLTSPRLTSSTHL